MRLRIIVSKTVFCVALFVSLALNASGADKYVKTLEDLTDGKPRKNVKSAVDRFLFAGLAGFPTLLAHLDDKRLCDAYYDDKNQSDSNPDGSLMRNPDGTPHHHHTTIGEACFDLIQEQVEGSWPFPLRDFYTLSPRNVRKWLDSHKGESLQQLFTSARAESIRRVEAALLLHPEDEVLNYTLAFLRENCKHYDDVPLKWRVKSQKAQ